MKIGFIGPLTGPIAIDGQDSLAGAKAAIAYLNSVGTAHGVKYDLIPEDSGGTGTGDVSATRKLIQDGVTAVIGDIGAGTTAAIQPLVTQAKVLSIGSNLQGFQTEAGTKFPYSFSDGEPAADYVAVATKYLQKQGASKIGVIYGEDPYGELEWSSDQAYAKAHGITIYGQSISDSATGVTPQLNKLKSEGAQGLEIWTYTPLPVLLGLGQIGWAPPATGPLDTLEPAVLQPAGKAASQVVKNLAVVMVPKTLLKLDGKMPSTAAAKGFFKYLPKSLGRDANAGDLLADYGFDWVMIIDGAIRNADSTNTTALVKALNSGKPVIGARGTYVFGPSPAERQGIPGSQQAPVVAEACPNALCEGVPGF